MIRPLSLFCVLLIGFASCDNSNRIKTNKVIHNVPLDGENAFDKQGHRGCRGLMPENTIPAMLHALSLGVSTLEMDVVLTKDEQVVLSHEPYFNHEFSTKPNGEPIAEIDAKDFNIYRMTYAEVSKFDVGIKGNSKFPEQAKMKVSKPLLSELVDSVQQYMVTRKRPMPFYNIETKCSPETDGIFHPAPAEFVEKLMSVIRKKGIESQVIIQSFDTRTLKYLHKKYPEIKTALLIDALDRRSFRKQLTDLGFEPNVYSPAESLVNGVLIKNCHDRNIKIIPWTVNDKDRIKELKKMGVDGIISDYPDRFPE